MVSRREAIESYSASDLYSADRSTTSTSVRALERITPEELVDQAMALGVAGLVVIDLADVGIGCRPSTGPLIRQLRANIPSRSMLAEVCGIGGMSRNWSKPEPRGCWWGRRYTGGGFQIADFRLQIEKI
jgi:hypothetical protein